MLNLGSKVQNTVQAFYQSMALKILAFGRNRVVVIFVYTCCFYLSLNSIFGNLNISKIKLLCKVWKSRAPETQPLKLLAV